MNLNARLARSGRHNLSKTIPVLWLVDGHMQNGLRVGAEAAYVCGTRGSRGYFRLPLESSVMPPGPLFFFSSFALRVPMALVVHALASTTSSFTAAGSA